MNTRIASKLAALAIALLMNTVILGGVAYLFDAQTYPQATVMALAKQLAASSWLI